MSDRYQVTSLRDYPLIQFRKDIKKGLKGIGFCFKKTLEGMENYRRPRPVIISTQERKKITSQKGRGYVLFFFP